MNRILELNGIRVLHTDWGDDSLILKSLRPEQNLNFRFPSDEITVLWLGVRSDPIRFTHSKELVKFNIMKTDRLYEYLNMQTCLDSGGEFNFDAILPPFQEKVTAKQWAHLFAHLSLIHAAFTVRQAITHPFEDRVFYNPANYREVCIAYNYSMRIGELGSYLEHLQNFMELLVKGKPDPDFLNWVEAHRSIYDHWKDVKKLNKS